LTTAACSGLRPEPDCRPRRTYLHLSYSYVSPFGPAILVTHDPKRSFARLRLRRQLRQIPFCAVRSQIAQLFVLHNLNLWSGSQWLPAASHEVVVLRVLSAEIFMSFRVLGYPPRCLRTEIFGGDMVRRALQLRRPPLMACAQKIYYVLCLVWLRGPATSFTERELNGGVVSNGRSYSQWFELGGGSTT
jgi:hypothetical protein